MSSELLRALDDAVRADLQSLHDGYFEKLLIYGFLVAAGIVFELPEVVNDIREAFSGQVPSKSVKKTVSVIGLIGWLMVASGVGGETIYEALVSAADTRSQAFESIVLADAQSRAGDAFERAGAAIERAAELEKEAAVLRENIVDMSPRADLLTGRRKERLARSISSFRGQRFAIGGCWPEATFGGEIKRTMSGLSAAMQEGQWTPLDLSTGASIGDVCGPSGLMVLVSSNASGMTQSAARSLVAALNEVPLKTAIGKRTDHDPRMGPDVIVVQVFTNPFEPPAARSTLILGMP